MTPVLLALVVGVLWATGTYLVLRRGQIKLIVGLALLSHGVNLFLFGSGTLTRGQPPIFQDKANYLQELASANIADPLPQALILTAIVISFGVTAFIVVLVGRRDALTGSDIAPGELAPLFNSADPFLQLDEMAAHTDEDYDILQFELDEVYDRQKHNPHKYEVE